MRLASLFVVFTSVIAPARLAGAQLFPDVTLADARPGVDPLLAPPQVPRPSFAFPIEKYTRRVEKSVNKGPMASSSESETTRRFDGSGHLIEMRKTVAGKLERGITMTYDAKGRVAKRIDEYRSGARYTYDFSYDDAGRLSKLADVGTDRPAQEMTLSYDAAGQLTTQAEASGGKVSTWRLLRSERGTLVSVVLDGADGKRVFIERGEDDAKGNLVRVTTGGWMAGEGITATWDGRRRLSTHTSKTAERTEVTRVTYDGRGHILTLRGETSEPSGSGTFAVDAKYDASGRLIKVTQNRSRRSGQAGSSNELVATTYRYDARGRLSSEHEDLGGGSGRHGFRSKSDTSYSYDAQGRLTEVLRRRQGYPPIDRTETVTFSY